MNDNRLPVYFVSHGAGPWSFMNGPFRRQFAKLEHSLNTMRTELGKAPNAILMISAHWEERGVAITASSRPSMIYDYVGFPDYTFRIQYGAPGSPAVARRIHELLQAGGIAARLDPERGFDHGMYAIMKPLFPAADVPVIQLSLDDRFDPSLHLEMGRLLAPLRDEGIVIIGSGQSFQNLQLRDARAIVPSQAFDGWLQQVVTQISPAERRERLILWEAAPYARLAHPREEHLMPLLVAVGAADSDAGVCIYHDKLGGVMVAAGFRFGVVPSA